MTKTRCGPLIEAELEADLERFAAWLANAEQTTRRRRRKARRPETARMYAERMRHLLKRVQTLEPTAGQLRVAFLAWMQEPTQFGKAASDSTVRNSFYALKAWAEWKGIHLGEKEDLLDDFDVPPIPPRGRGEESVMDPDEARVLLQRLAMKGDRRNYAIMRTFLHAGPRRRVISFAKIRHFLYSRRTILVDEVMGKGGHGGAIFVDPATADAIRDYLLTREGADAEAGEEGFWGLDPDAPLFHSYQTGGNLQPDSVTSLVVKLTTRLLGEAGRKTPHELRHTCLSYLGAGINGPPLPLAHLQKQALHADKKTTLRYIHVAGDARDAYDRAVGAVV